MRWISRVLAAVALLAAASCAGGRPSAPGSPPAPLTHLRIGLPDGTVRRVPLEEYVHVTVLSELAPSSAHAAAARRMFEVQAIVARSYAAANAARHRGQGYDLCATTHCQIYSPSVLKASGWARAAAEAVRTTAGRILWHGRGPASAVFHADCGGHTSGAHEIWRGGAREYLRALPDDGAAAGAHSTWRLRVEAARLEAVLNADPRTRVGSGLADLTILERDQGGRAALVALRGAREPLVRGEEFRAVLARAFGDRAFRSTAFTVTRAGSAFVFEGRGYGHGVGLCQAGALARLRAGATPADVLARYYPGTTLRTLQ